MIDPQSGAPLSVEEIWVECVPNFSEGRNPQVIQAIADAISACKVHLLDVSSDSDHHRTVMTIVGAPQAVSEAMLAGSAVAVAHIDLEVHQGQHPRLGAVDVVPFIPLRGCTLEDCAAFARQFAAQAAAQLDLPVYLYGAAAQRPERSDLALVRRGGYELLKEQIMLPARQPDYGPARVGRAGAMVVGARAALIAFNAFLNTADIEVARAIAGAIRASGGGLPHVKALGLYVGGRAQVSINLTDYRQTSLFEVMRALDREAAERGVRVEETEVVGLIPENALLDSALSSLRLPSHTRSLILERRVGAATGDFRPLFE